jgi:hypothetical protein
VNSNRVLGFAAISAVTKKRDGHANVCRAIGLAANAEGLLIQTPSVKKKVMGRL